VEYGQELAVVIVTYSPGETLERCLDTLEKATTRPYEVVLADNGSVDGAPEKAASRSNVTLLHTGGNLGYGTAANRGVATLGDEYGWIVVANPDLEFGPGSLDVLLAAASRWPRGGAFGPLIREPSGVVYPSARLTPSLGKGIGHAVVGRVWRDNPWTKAYKQSDTSVTEREAGWLSGSCLLMRRAAFDSVDGFDPRYFMYFEDVDLGDRLARAGWQNVYVPSAEILHDKGHATGRDPARNLAAHHKSTYTFLADRYPKWWQGPLRWTIRGSLAARAGLVVRSSRRKQAKGRR
jgi:N-acetylglucosaminyl-diphospho-decaprenol L-rhamnosyltransferase